MKVLSLAWKYHPFITSGVGVACEGFNNALSKLAELSVIYPKVSKVQVKQEVILDSENLTADQRKIIEEQYVEELDKGHFQLALNLDPYFISNQSFAQQQKVKKSTKESFEKVIGNKKIISHKIVEKEIFDDVDVFGEHVRDKVFLYDRLVEQLAVNIEFDIIHAHDWMTFSAGLLLKERYNKPLVIHVHSLEYDRVGHKDAGWVYHIERYSMSKADKVIAASEYTKGVIESSYGLSGDNVLIIHNAVTIPDKLPPFRAKSDQVFKILFAGRIDGNKGIEYFMEIAKHVLRQADDVEFIIVGRGKGNIRFHKIPGYNEIASKFKYLGFVERDMLFSLYSECDVLCMPSVSEPFGLTAIEAAYMELPVVLSTNTGAAEVLKRTPKADFWDTSKFAKAILSVKNNPSVRKRIIKNNKADIANLSWEESAKKAFAAFNGLLKS